MYARIIGTGSYLPARQVPNAELELQVDTSDEWVFQRTGIRSRHVAAAHEMTSDLAIAAAQQALSMANLAATDIDLVIVATTTPDLVFPSTACIVQRKLAIPEGACAFDVQAVCSGFIYALAIAEKFIASGTHRHALVIGAEVFSRLLDWSDRRTCVLFGDGAGAVVVAGSDTPGIRSTHLHAAGAQGDILQVRASPANPHDDAVFVEMDGQAVFRFAVRVLDSVCRETLEANGMTGNDIDWLVPHQANIRIIMATAKKLGMTTDRVVTTLEKQGNTSAASVPLALDCAVRDGRIQPGHTVMLEAVGGGMTWGAVLLDW
ncbi:MAG: beta-ketoacyl-ACP synthase III [Oceanococcaceae bacterium]